MAIARGMGPIRSYSVLSVLSTKSSASKLGARPFSTSYICTAFDFARRVSSSFQPSASIASDQGVSLFTPRTTLAALF